MYDLSEKGYPTAPSPVKIVGVWLDCAPICIIGTLEEQCFVSFRKKGSIECMIPELTSLFDRLLHQHSPSQL